MATQRRNFRAKRRWEVATEYFDVNKHAITHFSLSRSCRRLREDGLQRLLQTKPSLFGVFHLHSATQGSNALPQLLSDKVLHRLLTQTGCGADQTAEFTQPSQNEPKERFLKPYDIRNTAIFLMLDNRATILNVQ
jgi:hypothetical protein